MFTKVAGYLRFDNYTQAHIRYVLIQTVEQQTATGLTWFVAHRT